ncbi:hypothetical protein [Micromonospora sonneratiae]|uniref:Uncharacterized protein n=1 Tax=Micromonospora sonneratiae TaxID=1184706 RepID=A0ABW3YJ46_9ACTN
MPVRRVGVLGGLLLWFAVLGGALAWAVHLMAAWSVDELVCAAGSEEVAGLPLRLVVGLAVVIPAGVTLAALVVSWRAWQQTGRGPESDVPAGADVARAMDRSRLLAMVGIWSNLLFLSIIVLGGVATLVFPPCQR